MTPLAPPLALFLVGLGLFIAPHRGPQAPASKRSLAGAFADLLTERLGGPTRRRLAIRTLGGLGCTSVFVPAVVLLLLRALPASAESLVFGLGALVLLAATGAVTLVLLLSHANFGFGGGRSRDGNLFVWLIPGFVGASAIACGVALLSDGAADWIAGR